MGDVTSASPTNRVAVYPSTILRPPPSFLFEVPEGWVIDETPTALAMLRTKEQVDDFWPNVVVNSDRVPVGLELRDAANATFARFKEQHPDLKVRTEKLGAIAGRPTYLRALDITSPDGRALSQIQAMFFAPPPAESRTADLFQIVGTCTTPTIDLVGPAIVAVVTSFRLT